MLKIREQGKSIEEYQGKKEHVATFNQCLCMETELYQKVSVHFDCHLLL